MKDEFKDSTVKRIGIKETIGESWELYKDNFKLFISIALIGFIIDFINAGLIDINRFLSINEYGLALKFLILLLLIVVFYYSCKITITFYICISMRYKNINTSIKYCYKNASAKVWRYIGTCFKFVLMLLIPVIVLIIVMIISRGKIRYFGISVIMVPIIYLATINGFAPIISILEDKKLPCFKISREIVKGDFWRIILLVFLTIIIFNIPYYIYMNVFNNIRMISPHKKFIASIINDIMMMFTCPFSMSVQVMMYFRLKEKAKELFNRSLVE